jgi:hypothetical protein
LPTKILDENINLNRILNKIQFLKWYKLLSNFKIEGLDSLIRVQFKILKLRLDNIHGELFSAPLAIFIRKQI